MGLLPTRARLRVCWGGASWAGFCSEERELQGSWIGLLGSTGAVPTQGQQTESGLVPSAPCELVWAGLVSWTSGH